MFRKKRLLAIPELNLAGKIEQMNYEQLNEYFQTLKSFVEDFPANEKKLKIALEARDYVFFEKYLSIIGEMLTKIHADDIASECQKQIDGLKNAKHEKIEAFATYFLKLVSMLYVDIQKLFINVMDKEHLLAISELKLAGKIEQMDDEQLSEYIQSLDFFIENFPKKESELKIALEAKNYYSFTKSLTAIEDMLIKIHADDAASECRKQIIGLKNAKYEKIEAFTTYFLESISMMSIDIQMTEYKSREKENKPSDSTGETKAGNKPADNTVETKVEKNILAVDDTEFFLRRLKALLENTPYKLTCTTSVDVALNFLQKNHPDLFILDILMPEMSGYELAQKIRECGQTAPIIFLTGNSTHESVEKALKAGAADFILKPISKKQLLDRITKFI